jgi:hypothetical protein
VANNLEQTTFPPDLSLYLHHVNAAIGKDECGFRSEKVENPS